jgi:hypothetical protein
MILTIVPVRLMTPANIDAFARKPKGEWLSKKRQMQGAQGRGMRRTQVRRSDESNCSNAAVGEFLRRHPILTSPGYGLKDCYHLVTKPNRGG